MDRYEIITIEEAEEMYELGYELVINDGKVIHALPKKEEE